jgi:hypothetical protein
LKEGFREAYKRWEDEKENESSYWMTVRKGEDTGN